MQYRICTYGFQEYIHRARQMVIGTPSIVDGRSHNIPCRGTVGPDNTSINQGASPDIFRTICCVLYESSWISDPLNPRIVSSTLHASQKCLLEQTCLPLLKVAHCTSSTPALRLSWRERDVGQQITVLDAQKTYGGKWTGNSRFLRMQL